MMKRNVIALAVSALLAAGSANAAEIYNKNSNKLDLYGKVVGLHYFSDDDDNDGDQTYIRFGFKGETQITDEVIGFGQWEYNVQANNPEGGDTRLDGNKTRLGFAGLKFGDAGSIDYGRNYSVIYDSLAWTDMLPEFGGDLAAADTMAGRSTGVLTYRNTDFFGLVDGWDFAVQYQGKNERDNIGRSNGDGWGASTTYTSPIGVAVVGAYASRDRTFAQQDAFYAHGGKRAELWSVGLKYDANNIYLAATYSEGRNATPFVRTLNGNSTTGIANKTQDIELVGQYQFDFGLRPSLAYVQTKAKDVEGIGDVDLTQYVEVGATYYFNKNMSAYVDYRINQYDNENALGISPEDIVALGVVYQF